MPSRPDNSRGGLRFHHHGSSRKRSHLAAHGLARDLRTAHRRSHACDRPTRPQAGTDENFGVIESLDATLVRLGTLLVWWGVLALLFTATFRSADAYFSNREKVLAAMKHFGDRFVQEFERSLIQQHRPGRPIRSRFRFDPDRLRLEVLLSPDAGLRYPNLTDHRKNVEYDVMRVLELLSDPSFVCGQMYAQGCWVVIPFQLRADRT